MIKLSFDELLKLANQYKSLEKKKPHFSTTELKDYLNHKKLLNQHNLNFEKIKVLEGEDLSNYIMQVLENPEFEKVILEKVNMNVIDKVEEKKTEAEQLFSTSLSDNEYVTTIIEDNIDHIVKETKKIRNEVKEDIEETIRINTGSKFKLEINEREIAIQIPKKGNIIVEPSLLIELYKKTFSGGIIEIEKQLQEPVQNEIIEEIYTEEMNETTSEDITIESTEDVYEKVALNVTLNMDIQKKSSSGLYKLPVGNIYFAPFNINRLSAEQYNKYYEPYRHIITGNTNEEIVSKIFNISLVDGLLPKGKLKLEDINVNQIIQLRIFAGQKFIGIISVLKALTDIKDEQQIKSYVCNLLSSLPDDDISKIFSSDVLHKVRENAC